MFRTVPVSIIMSFSLYTPQWYMSYRFADCSQAVWHIPLLCVQWKTPDDAQRNCPKHEEFYSKNKFEELVYLVGFVIRIYHDVRPPERHISERCMRCLLQVLTDRITSPILPCRIVSAFQKAWFQQAFRSCQAQTTRLIPINPRYGTPALKIYKPDCIGFTY